MNAPFKLADQIDDRELREAADVEMAAQRLVHELRKVAYWKAAKVRGPINTRHDAERLWVSASDRAEQCRLEMLRTFAVWSELDAVDQAWRERR